MFRHKSEPIDIPLSYAKKAEIDREVRAYSYQIYESCCFHGGFHEAQLKESVDVYRANLEKIALENQRGYYKNYEYDNVPVKGLHV